MKEQRRCHRRLIFIASRRGGWSRCADQNSRVILNLLVQVLRLLTRRKGENHAVQHKQFEGLHAPGYRW